MFGLEVLFVDGLPEIEFRESSGPFGQLSAPGFEDALFLVNLGDLGVGPLVVGKPFENHVGIEKQCFYFIPNGWHNPRFTDRMRRAAHCREGFPRAGTKVVLAFSAAFRMSLCRLHPPTVLPADKKLLQDVQILGPPWRVHPIPMQLLLSLVECLLQNDCRGRRGDPFFLRP